MPSTVIVIEGYPFALASVSGKVLYAKTEVPVYRSVVSGYNPVYIAKPGESIGAIRGEYNVPPGGIPSPYPDWIMFRDVNNELYYTPNIPGLYSLQKLKQQGGKGTKEYEEGKEIWPKVAKIAGFLALVIGTAHVLGKQKLF